MGGCNALCPAVEDVPFTPPDSYDAPQVWESPQTNTDGLDKTDPPCEYIAVCGSGVNVRTGAGTGYKSLGQAQNNDLYCLLDCADGWYTVYYRGQKAYISAAYCKRISLPSSGCAVTESIIAEGEKLLGTPYVYGAVRCHDGQGNLISGFTPAQFDCSSLMQYIFYKGGGINLGVTTRTQVYEGEHVPLSQIARGDLLFFTNSSRKMLQGVQRVGHVALYLGQNYILHTSSDYAKIEYMPKWRLDMFLEARRIPCGYTKVANPLDMPASF